MFAFSLAPLSANPTGPEIPAENPSPSRGILVVDDEEMVRSLVRLVSHQQGIPVWTASTGADAVKVYREHAAEIAFVMLDVRMPGMDGPHTLLRLKELNPQLSFCFMSGDSTPYTEAELIAMGAKGLVPKPFPLKTLATIVYNCVADHA